MQYETCRHVKEDGAYCGSPALQSRKYCYFHLTYRGRRLRRARALRYNEPCGLDIPQLEDLRSIQVALTEIVQGLAAGQIDRHDAKVMLYAVQQATTVSLRLAKLEAQALARADQAEADAKGACPQQNGSDNACIREYPGFEQKYAIQPGSDIDVETNAALQKADEEAALRLPVAPLGERRRISPVEREEAYQVLKGQLHNMKLQLREYHEMKRQEVEKLKKEMLSASPPAERLVNSA